MTETQREPNIKKACSATNRLQDLQTISVGLEKCQKSLNDYLDSKRNAFPRFFFISDDELLSILGSSDPSCVQEHMIKMFDNIASLRLVKNQDNVTAQAMISAEKEVMEFKQHVIAEGRVEDWMTKVLHEMRRTNRLITKESIYYYKFQKTRFSNYFLNQILKYRMFKTKIEFFFIIIKFLEKNQNKIRFFIDSNRFRPKDFLNGFRILC